MNVMVISPHHDDEVIGCGGSIYLHSKRNNLVTVVYATAGWSGIPSLNSRTKAIDLIQKEAKAACQKLGVSHTVELSLEDRAFSLSKNTLNAFVRAFRELSPDIVYIPYSDDGDNEHRLVNQISREALWIAESEYLPKLGIRIAPVKIVLGYEVWKPMPSYQFSVDITSAVKTKKEALRQYKSQLRVKDWARAALSLNNFRGIISGRGEYAEVFQVIRANVDLF